MHFKFGVWSLSLHFLLLQGNYEVRAKDLSSVQTYFNPEDIKPGTIIHTYFDDIDPTKLPGFLPREEADSIPFTSAQLRTVLDRFGIPPGSPQAVSMAETLRACEGPTMEGETIFCATSLESMLDFVHRHFRPHKLQAVSTRNVSSVTAQVQDFTIVGQPVESPAPKTVACHTMSWPYTVYFCHFDVWGRRVFRVSLMGEHGGTVDAAAVCHVDTSRWNPHHVSFRVLGVEHGSPVCHFFPADHLLWVPRFMHMSA